MKSYYKYFLNIVITTLFLLFSHTNLAQSTVTIRSFPLSAKVYEGGNFLGVTPLELTYSPNCFKTPKWLYSKRCSQPITLTVSKQGYSTKYLRITKGPFTWRSFNGQNAYSYYLIKYYSFMVHLDAVEDISKQLKSQCLPSEMAYKEYLLDNIRTLDPIEGIWSLSVRTIIYQNGKIIASDVSEDLSRYGIAKKGNIFPMCLIQSNSKKLIKSKRSFKRTSIENVYLYSQVYEGVAEKVGANATIKSNSMIEFSHNLPLGVIEHLIRSNGKDPTTIQGSNIKVEGDVQMIKIFPTEEVYLNNAEISASGFAISSNGIIVTNYHVVENAENIFIRGVNGNFDKRYSAKVLLSDRHNDLAFLQIDDDQFSSCGPIPFRIANSTSKVGENVFVMGYPLRATMGDELKLTDGIISAKTGFQGDITSYQISAPVQPGNSGAPVFDASGILIGIINAKNLEAENASYAIKSTYLMVLLEGLSEKISFRANPQLANHTLPKKVELLRQFVYIIEVNSD